MRVLLVTANYRPSVGGIERFVEVLAEGLAARGHEVTVATCWNRGGPRTEDGPVRVERIPSSDVMHTRLGVPYPLPAPRAALRTLRTLVRGTDVVNPQDALYLTSVTTLVLARRLGVPSVLTQHVTLPPQGHAALDLAQRLASGTLGQVARLADVVATPNPSVGDWAKRTWGLREVRTLPVGVPAPTTSSDERPLVRRELGLAEDAFVALFAGRDVTRKRLDVFLAADDPSYELVAVTDRTDDGRGSARIVPFMAPEQFRRLLGAADAFVLPSVGEGLPIAFQEALVAGVPCVVTREPGYERYVSDEDVVFVPPEPAAIRTALRQLASDPEYRRGLSERARAVGEREFGVERFVDAYERLYAEVRR